jgi:hypothetical protein
MWAQLLLNAGLVQQESRFGDPAPLRGSHREKAESSPSFHEKRPVFGLGRRLKAEIGADEPFRLN